MDDKLSRFEQLIKAANQGLASYDDVKRLMEALIKVIKDTKADLERKAAQNKRENDATITQAITDIKAAEKTLTSIVRRIEEKTARDAINTQKQIDASVKALRKEIPTVPDYTNEFLALANRIGEIAEDMLTPDALKPLREDIDENYEDIKKLQKELERTNKGVAKLKGAAHVPSPMHVPTHEEFTMNGSDTSVTLMHAVGAAGNAVFNVTYQGQVLRFGENYTVNGNKITFVGFTPANTKIITVTYLP